MSKDTLLQIMEINLGALKIPMLRAEVVDLIVIDQETFDIHLDHLVTEERYEDCRLLTDNQDDMIYERLLQNQQELTNQTINQK